jgi:hypothetical protein
MGNDAADMNNDGNIDLLTLDMLPEDNYGQKLVAGPDNYDKVSILKNTGFYHQTTRNMLQINNHGSYFTEIGQYAGICSTNWSWCPLLFDMDNNGHKDLYISNGYAKNNTHMDFIKLTVDQVMKKRTGGQVMTRMGLVDQIPSTRLKNYIFRNNGDLTFTNVTDIWGDEQPSLANGTAYTDLDNDGDLDLVANQINDYALVYRNNARETNDNHYIRIRLEGAGLNREGIGARVQVSCSGKTYTQEFMPSRGYMSSGSHVLVFGLGNASSIDSIHVTWPDLREQVMRNVDADQTITLNNKDAAQASPPVQPAFHPLFEKLTADDILEYRHRENEYNDFREQILLPHMLSTQGPHMAMADVNGDGLDDIFIGGASGSPGRLFLQTQKGRFTAADEKCFEADRACEDIGSLFFDADGDHDADLYVVSGGNEFSPESPELQDRLYMNNGKGHFSRSQGRLPVMLTSGSCVRACDFDSDGDTDLFIGGRLIPGSYPLPPRSYLLMNDGKGYFSDVTAGYCKELLNPGLVADARWADITGDKKPDLVLTGEWMKIRVFSNDGSHLQEITGQCGLESTSGWWNTIVAEDLDSDGDIDLVAGNLGLNSQVRASSAEPVTIYARDFDNNGSTDAIMCYYMQGVSYPFYSKDDLQDQMSFIEKKYPTYESYTMQKITDIFTQAELSNALVLKAELFETCLIENNGDGTFRVRPLPREAQFSPVYSVNPGDFNKDGFTDLLLAGNFFGSRIKFGEYDASRGLVLLGDGKNNFRPLNDLESGLNIRGEVRDIKKLRQADGKDLFFFARNNDSLSIYSLRRNEGEKK